MSTDVGQTLEMVVPFCGPSGDSSSDGGDVLAASLMAPGGPEWEEELLRIEAILQQPALRARIRQVKREHQIPVDNTSAVSVLDVIVDDLPAPVHSKPQHRMPSASNMALLRAHSAQSTFGASQPGSGSIGFKPVSKQSRRRDVLGVHLVRETKSQLAPSVPFPSTWARVQGDASHDPVASLGLTESRIPNYAHASRATVLTSSSSVSSHVSMTPQHSPTPKSPTDDPMMSLSAFDSPESTFPIDFPSPCLIMDRPPQRFSIDSPLPFVRARQEERDEGAPKPCLKSRRPKKQHTSLPSRFCHLCSRTQKSKKVVCANITDGSCRKAVCEPCFSEQQDWDWEKATAPGSNWKCPHCLGLCHSIPRARCIIYKAVNTKRRNARIALQRKRADNILDTILC
jgi:hypothetical protein